MRNRLDRSKNLPFFPRNISMSATPSALLSLLVFLAVFIAASNRTDACIQHDKSSGLTKPLPAPARADEDNLSQEFAQFRKSQVKKVDYDLTFDLKKGADSFSGYAIIDIELESLHHALSFDFTGKKLVKVLVNGREVKNFVTRTGSFDIPAEYLSAQSKIEVEYVGDFSKDSHGFQRSVDPEDQAEYLFTDFEPYFAHRLFPSFDQPNLKATFKLKVSAPSNWRVVSNNLPTESKISGERVEVRFPPTPQISTYLVFLGAGPFEEWSDKTGEVPVYIWARKSLARYLDPDRIFDTSKKGLRFFGDYFGYKYPFEKFGMIFIPEFAWGGMENPGAIAMNERNIFRGPVSQSRYEGRDSLILHEMAHMWFGDLVTMRWWNDLWLNESFATYAATLAQDRALGSQNAWIDFASTKTWGYWQDQLVTTHPIETGVPDVRTGKGNFDGITYAKGGASLKQLHFYVGEDGFRNGLRSYFRKYAFSNTIRNDFTTEIATASKTDLKNWTKSWLQTAGPNRVHAKWQCTKDSISGDSKISSFSIEQKPNASHSLSPHRTRIGLFSLSDGKLVSKNTTDVSYTAASTKVSSLIGTSCPDFVFPNVDDQDYALFSLDPNSLKHVEVGLRGGINQPILRLLLWNTLNQMLRDSQLPVTEYMKYAISGLKHEKDDGVLGRLLGRHSSILYNYSNFLSRAERAKIAPNLESVIWSRVNNATPGSSIQMSFFDFYLSIAQTPEAVTRMQNLISGKEIPTGIQIDQDRRWELISSLASNGAAGINEFIAAEEKRDPTTTGTRAAYAARIAIPASEAKKTFWSDFQSHEKIPFSSLRLASQHFNHPNFTELTEAYVEPFFTNISKVDWSANDDLVEIYFENIFPQNICTPNLLKVSKSNLKKAKNLTKLAQRAWLEANDELAKCVAVRNFSKINK